MPKADDPYYNRKPVPTEFVKDVGWTGLTPEEEYLNRERKYSVNGGDVRKFSSGKEGSLHPTQDPYYARKKVHETQTIGVGDTGLSSEEEFLNRERKYSVQGGDLRQFASGKSGSLHPSTDPYYNRGKVDAALTKGIGETGNDAATDFEVRERKQSVANFSGDPFAIVSGTGHRQSISGGVMLGAATEATRRRSSAVGPDAAAAMASHGQHHSGYDGDKLAPIVSKPELPPVNVDSIQGDSSHVAGTTPHATTTTTTSTTTTANPNGHTQYYDAATSGHHDVYDPDSVAPHETR